MPPKDIGLSLLDYYNHLQVRKEGDQLYIIDPVRKKRIKLKPEELVRQLCIQYLTQQLHIPFGYISCERALDINGIKRRYDLVVFNRDNLTPQMIIECKAPEIELTQNVYDQICNYNLVTKAPYLWLSNGRQNFVLEYTVLDGYIPMNTMPDLV